MTKHVLAALIVTSLAPGCGPPALTCQTQTCSGNSSKNYQLCVNIDASQSWSFGGMSCHAGTGNVMQSQTCEQQVASYCGGGTTAGMDMGGGGGSNCSLVGTFTATTNTGGHATMVDSGSTQSGTSNLTIVTPNTTIMIAATYSVSGNDVTMVNTSAAPSTVQGCLGQAAVYSLTWDATCAHFTMNKVSDQCSGRIADANGVTLTRQ